MRAIGVRELKTHASEIMRKVRERDTCFSLWICFTITYRGKPRAVGVLLPLEELKGRKWRYVAGSKSRSLVGARKVTR